MTFLQNSQHQIVQKETIRDTVSALATLDWKDGPGTAYYMSEF